MLLKFTSLSVVFLSITCYSTQPNSKAPTPSKNPHGLSQTVDAVAANFTQVVLTCSTLLSSVGQNEASHPQISRKPTTNKGTQKPNRGHDNNRQLPATSSNNKSGEGSNKANRHKKGRGKPLYTRNKGGKTELDTALKAGLVQYFLEEKQQDSEEDQ